MKRILRCLIIVLLTLLGFGCKPKSNEPINAAEAEMGLADSSNFASPWIKYSYAERAGMRLYNHYCAVCHGLHGEGDGFNAYNLNPRPRNLADSTYVAALSDATLEQIISYGGRGVNRSVMMPAYQNTITEEEITYLIDYIRTFSQNNNQ